MSDIGVKICGLKSPGDVAAISDAGATHAGFVFFERSPRNIGLEAARALALSVPRGIARVALVVDADDATLEALTARVPLDLLQLHGRESPARVAEIRARHGLAVMKAVGIRTGADLARIADYEAVADRILVDAKPPEGAALPGGNGLAFDWRLIAGRRWAKPWMLAGGLTPETVREAITRTGADAVDVSTGVEAAPGVKDARKIAEFVAAARSAALVARP